MLQIPHHILQDLKCSVCNGYLSSKPLMIKPENEHVCGKCFMIIPTEEKEKCLRETALESLASVFLFPCRYNKQGCKYTFPWDHDRNHENSCSFRYKNHFRNSTGSEFFNKELIYDINQNSEAYQNLTYLNLQRTIRNDASVLQNKINISIEGAGTQGKQEIEYDKVIDEHIYDSLTPLIKNSSTQQHCFNCKAVLGEDAFNCSLGHTSCGNCKGSMCMVCVNIYEKESKSLCKYHQNGCKENFKQDELNKHQANCLYRDISCLFEPCKHKSILEMLKYHMKEYHPDKVLSSNELTKTFATRDETLVFLCFDKIFKFVYYYYKTFVEFVVTSVGSSEEASNFLYEISVQNGDDYIRRKSKCASWNDSMLAKGINFDRKDILDSNKKKVSFEIQLRIFHLDK